MLQKLKNWLFGTTPQETWHITLEYMEGPGYVWVARRHQCVKFITPDKQRLEEWMDEQDHFAGED